MPTINREKTALTLQERIAEITALEKVSEPEVRHHSDGTELIPAEIQASIRRNDGQLPDAPSVAGYTVDKEGIINNYATEPKIYFAGYTTYEQQKRYIRQGHIATLLVFMAFVTAFSV